MKKRKLGKKNIREFERVIIQSAIARLPNGEERLYVSGVPLSDTLLARFSSPDLTEMFLSDSGTPGAHPAIGEEYEEEINTIEKLIDGFIKKAQQSGDLPDAVEELWRGKNIRAWAMRIWDWYGIPWRFRGGNIYLIFSPQDLFGTPIIHCYEPSVFMQELASKVWSIQKKAKRLEVVGAVTVIAMIVIVFVMAFR